jgi:hypothetical protein
MPSSRTAALPSRNDARAWRFCATGAMIRAGYELTGDIYKAQELRDRACERLYPASRQRDPGDREHQRCADGHARILALFDDYLART